MFKPKNAIGFWHNLATTTIPYEDYSVGYFNQLIDFMLDRGWCLKVAFSHNNATKSVFVAFKPIQ